MKIVISETPPYFLDMDAPTLRAYKLTLEGVRVWRVWCCHCDRWHEHGAGGGHRVAHCGSDTPYSRTGYKLAYAGPWSDGSRSIGEGISQ